MGAQSEEREDSRSHGGAGVWAFWLGVAVLVYVLSVGPVVLVLDKMRWLNRPATEAALNKVYAPLVWAHEHTPLRKPLDWYIALWDKNL